MELTYEIDDLRELIGNEFTLYVENIAPQDDEHASKSINADRRLECLILDTGGLHLKGIDGVWRPTFRPRTYHFVDDHNPPEKVSVTVDDIWLQNQGKIYRTMGEVIEAYKEIPFRFQYVMICVRFAYKGRDHMASAFQKHLLDRQVLEPEQIVGRIMNRPTFPSKQTAYHNCLRRVVRNRDETQFFFVGIFDGLVDVTQLDYPIGYTWLAVGQHSIVGAKCTEIDIPTFVDFVYKHGGKVVNIELKDWRNG